MSKKNTPTVVSKQHHPNDSTVYEYLGFAGVKVPDGNEKITVNVTSIGIDFRRKLVKQKAADRAISLFPDEY